MRYRSPKTASRALAEVANTQGGYFTAKQAAEAGYAKQHLRYHVQAGNFVRVGWGLFRLPTVPVTENDDLVRLSLWSRARDDRPQAVVSYESALALHALGDLIPGKVHLTVPRGFRKRPPRGVALHKAALAPADAQEWSGFRVTTPLRTLLDAAAARSVPQEQLDRAVQEALERGLVRRSKIVQAIRERPSAARLSSSLSAER